MNKPERENKRYAQRFSWDPVFPRDDGWYFWDEYYETAHGPYATQMDADKEFTKYCREIVA
jgi:hypothetical protein